MDLPNESKPPSKPSFLNVSIALVIILTPASKSPSFIPKNPSIVRFQLLGSLLLKVCKPVEIAESKVLMKPPPAAAAFSFCSASYSLCLSRANSYPVNSSEDLPSLKAL